MKILMSVVQRPSSGMEDAMRSWHDKFRTLYRELVWVVKWEPGPGSGTRLSRLSRAAPRVSRGECGLAPLFHEGSKVCWHAVCVREREIGTRMQRSWVGQKGSRAKLRSRTEIESLVSLSHAHPTGTEPSPEPEPTLNQIIIFRYK